MVVVYHETMGTPTDYGYGYKVVEPSEVESYVKQGWYKNSLDVPTNIHRVAAEVEEEKLKPEPEAETNADPEKKLETEKAADPKKKVGRPSKK
jgi:hypothetical protein